MGVILLCHEGMQKSANALGDDFHRFGGKMGKHTWASTCEWSDQVAHVTKDFVSVVKQGDLKGKAKLKNEKRWMIFEGSPARDAKSRAGFEMPSKIEFSWDEYCKSLPT